MFITEHVEGCVWGWEAINWGDTGGQTFQGELKIVVILLAVLAPWPKKLAGLDFLGNPRPWGIASLSSWVSPCSTRLRHSSKEAQLSLHWAHSFRPLSVLSGQFRSSGQLPLPHPLTALSGMLTFPAARSALHHLSLGEK